MLAADRSTEPSWTDDEIGVGAHLFVVGFRVGVRPMEFADMFANLAGQDLCGDNVLWPRLCLLHKWHKPKATDEAPAEAPADAGITMEEARRRIEEAAERVDARADEMARRVEAMKQ